MKNNKRPNKAQGYTLIEILLALAGASAITVGAVQLGGVVSQRSDIATATATARQIISGVDSRFSVTLNYHGIGEQPPTFVDGVKLDGNAIITPWGLATLLAESDRGPDDNWSVIFDNVPRAACATFVAQASPLFAFTSINKQANTAKIGEAMAPGEAAQYCNETANTVQFLARSLNTTAASVQPSWVAPIPSTLPQWIAPPPAIADGGGANGGGGRVVGSDESTTLYPIPTPTPPPATAWAGHPTRPTAPEPTPTPTPPPPTVWAGHPTRLPPPPTVWAGHPTRLPPPPTVWVGHPTIPTPPTATPPQKCDEQSQPGQDLKNSFCVDKPPR